MKGAEAAEAGAAEAKPGTSLVAELQYLYVQLEPEPVIVDSA